MSNSRFSACFVVLGAACLLHACSGDDGPAPSMGTSGSSGRPDQVSLPNAPASRSSEEPLPCPDPHPEAESMYRQFYEELQTLYCRRQFECCTEEERGGLGGLGEDTQEECLQEVGEYIPDLDDTDVSSMECGRILFRADLAATCLAELRNGTCSDLDQLPNCVQVRTAPETERVLWEPRSQPGAACEGYSLDCAGGYCETPSVVEQGIGQCAPWKSNGAACDSDLQCKGALCAGGDTCETIFSIDDPFCRRY
jgi:hypothetical protein